MAIRPAVAPPEATVSTACPLDCPDSCSVRVTVKGGRVAKIDGGYENPVTNGAVCAKVGRFDRRLYGEDRLRFPAVRVGKKGQGQFKRTSWNEALDRISERFASIRQAHGGEAILPVSYGGSNGLITQDTADAAFFARLGAARLVRAGAWAPVLAAADALYGAMPSVSYQDYPEARLILVWGSNPCASGIHLLPYLKEARGRGAVIVAIDPRVTGVVQHADIHLAPRPGTDLAIALAIHRHLFETGAADRAFLESHASGAERLRAQAQAWTFTRAADVCGIAAERLGQLARLYAETAPALVKCGCGLARNRNGGHAALAVMALPAVAGKFGVRGGGLAVNNSRAWGGEPPEAPGHDTASRVVNINRLGRELLEPGGTPIRGLFVYNCNPVATLPDQRRVLAGLERDDLFTVVFDQVLTDTGAYADVVLPATTFFEHYDLVRSYGPITLQMVRPAIEPVAESRPNVDVFGDLAARMDLAADGDVDGELDQLLRVMGALPPEVRDQLGERGAADPPFGGRPVQFVDVFPGTSDGRVQLWPERLLAEPDGLYRYVADPATADHPLALIVAASERTVASTLGELERPSVRLEMHPDDAAARGLEDGDDVRVFNDLGEMRCPVRITVRVRQGTVSFPRGVWRRHTSNHLTANALVPDDVTDFGGGACGNDARVEVAPLTSRP